MTETRSGADLVLPRCNRRTEFADAKYQAAQLAHVRFAGTLA